MVSPQCLFQDLSHAPSKKTCPCRLPFSSDSDDHSLCCCRMSRKLTHHIATILFFGFGLWSLWDGFHEEGKKEIRFILLIAKWHLYRDAGELAEVEKQLDADFKGTTATAKAHKDDDDKKKEMRPFLTQLFSPILLKAFSITFFGEWGDKSQLATIGLAANENPFGVVLGGILGQTLCTIAAVVGGKSLASQISEKMVALFGGVLFIIFGIQSFLSPVD
ncbi:GDT1-like protein 5 [Bienertia sinuspersici]